MASCDYLKMLCDEYGILLQYTDNDYTILSTETSKNNKPVLKAYNYFKGCSKHIAQAIINYYTSEVTDNKYVDEIYNYLGENIFHLGCVIDPPDSAFKKLIKTGDGSVS